MTRLVDFQIDGPEDHLYRDVTHFVKHESAKAAAQGDDRAVGFFIALYQRRLASSTYALRHSLENRAKRLADGLSRAQAIVQSVPPDLPDPEESEELEEHERKRLEEMLAAVTLAGNADQVREETGELQRLARLCPLAASTKISASMPGRRPRKLSKRCIFVVAGPFATYTTLRNSSQACGKMACVSPRPWRTPLCSRAMHSSHGIAASPSPCPRRSFGRPSIWRRRSSAGPRR
jgi:hypothetical protein